MNEAIKKYSSVLSELALNTKSNEVDAMCEAFAKNLHENGLSLQAGLIIEKARETAQRTLEKRRVVIKSAKALDVHTRERALQYIESKLGRSFLLEEVVDPTLLSGIVIDMPGTKIDASLSGRINKLSKHLI